MKVSVKDLSSCEKVLTIDVPQNVVADEYDAYFAAVAKKARVPGFRPGHAPKHVIAIRFKEQAREEVLRELLARSYREAVRQKEISPISYPRIDQVEFDDQHLKFNAHIELRPNIKMDTYVGLNLKREVAPVQDSEIEDVLKRLQESNAKFEPVENRSAVLGDYLISECRLAVDGKEIDKRGNEWIEIREKDYLEGFSKQLMGVKVGESREVTVTFPTDYSRKDLRGKQGHFSVAVKEMKTKTLPSLDDDLAKSIGSYQTFDELKAAIRRDLETHKRHEAEGELEKTLFDELMKRSKFEIPSGMVERRLGSLLGEQAERFLSAGMKDDEVKQKLEELKTDFKVESEKQVKISFILSEIAKRENVKVEEADFEAKYRSIAERVNRSAQEVKSSYHEQKERLETLELQIINEKVVQWIKNKAVITELPEAKEGGRR